MRLNKELAKYYYTAAEARKVLGLHEQALQYWVRKGHLHKTTLPGRSQGVYPKKEVDDIANQIEAAIIAQKAEGLMFRKATVDDLEEEYKLARTIFGRHADTPEIRQGKRAFLEKNPDIDYHLYDQGNFVGCIHIIPLQHQAILDFLEGKIIAWLIDTKNIEQFLPGKPLECLFLDALTTPGVEPIKRAGYASYMIAKFAKVLAEWGNQGVEISKAYGGSRTPSGIRILKNAGFQILEEREGGGIICELDIMKSDERILRTYKQNLQHWKEQHETIRESKPKKRSKQLTSASTDNITV